MIIFFDIDNTIHFGYEDRKFVENIKLLLLPKDLFEVCLITSRLKSEMEDVKYIVDILQPKLICYGDGSIYDDADSLVQRSSDALIHNKIMRKILNKKLFRRLVQKCKIKYQPKCRQSLSRVSFKIPTSRKFILKFISLESSKIKGWEYVIGNYGRIIYIDFFNSSGGKLSQIKKLINNEQDLTKIYYFGDSGQDLICSQIVKNFYFVGISNAELKNNRHVLNKRNIKVIKTAEIASVIEGI